MSSKELPARWGKRLIDKGFTDPRFKAPTPSMSALASKLDIHTSTVSNAIFGRTEPDIATVNALVAELGEDVAEWLGIQHFGYWDPPESSTLLDPRQRKALEELIVSITSKKESGDVAPAAEKIDNEVEAQRKRRESTANAKRAARRTTDPRKPNK